jgi:hypothetical protein
MKKITIKSASIFLSRTMKNMSPLLILAFFSLNISTIYGQSADLDQVRNGSAASRISPADWVNGNAGPSNAHYAEGYSIPYRMKISGLVGTAATEHTLIIEWDTKDQNGHAIDYITHFSNMDNPVGSHQATFNHAAEVIDPTIGTAFLGTLPTLFPITAPSSAGSEVAGQPTTSFNNLPTVGYTNNPDITKMAIWGGTIISMTYLTQDAPNATTASTKTRLSIKFKSTNGSTALIAWAGHIAAEYDWGAGRGATGVSGSPYHTRLISIDGTGGNQDRSLKASAVIIPPPVCGISPAQLACPETASLTFDATGSSVGLNISYVWTINSGNTAGAKINGSNTGFSISVVPIGSAFIAGGTFNLSLQVNKTGATATTCTRVPAGTIQKVLSTASASPTLIDITSLSHSTTLTANIDATSTDPNNANYNYVWSIVTAGTTGSLSNANQRIATYTAGIGDVNSTIQFKVIATQKNSPYCVDDPLVSVSLNSITPCGVSPQTAICQGTTTTHNGTPNPKPSTATYIWSLEALGGGGATNSTLIGANGGVSIQVNAIESYRIILSEVYENTAANSSCFQDVVVVPTPTVQTQYNAPSCSEKTFTVDVTNPVNGFSYSIDQPGNNIVFPPIVPSAGSPNVKFTGLTNGDGFTVTVTTNVAGCINTSSCATNPPPIAPLIVSKSTADANTTIVAKSAESYRIVLESLTKVGAMPNPYTDKINFNLVSAVSGIGTLELYNSLGQKVGVVFEGYVEAGREFSKEYNVPIEQRHLLLYVFKVGEQRVSGKLFGQK